MARAEPPRLPGGVGGGPSLDPYSQALSKIERGFAQDLADVASMVSAGLIDPARAQELFAEIEPELFRYPAIDAAAFRAKVARAFGGAL
jgi:hypothetical protein